MFSTELKLVTINLSKGIKFMSEEIKGFIYVLLAILCIVAYVAPFITAIFG